MAASSMCKSALAELSGTKSAASASFAKTRASAVKENSLTQLPAIVHAYLSAAMSLKFGALKHANVLSLPILMEVTAATMAVTLATKEQHFAT